jgi:hypothetical protein
MMPPMNRREAVKTTALAVGGVLLATSGAMASRAPERPARAAGVLSAEDRALVDEIADTLLPSTPGSPGAKAAGVGATIDVLLTDCSAPEEQRRVLAGLREFRRTSQRIGGGAFAALSPEARGRVVATVDAEAQRVGDAHWFSVVRGLALQSYFTSEIGMTKARRYIPVPGRWVGCMPLEPGQPAWG